MDDEPDDFLCRKATWTPEYQPLTAELLAIMLDSGLTTARELRLWSRDRLKEPKKSILEQRLILMRLVVTDDVPVQ